MNRMLIRGQIHVSEQRYKQYTAMDEIYKELLTTDPDKSRFHSCRWPMACARRGYKTTSIHPTPVSCRKPYRIEDVQKLLKTDLPYRARIRQHMVRHTFAPGVDCTSV